MSLPPTVRTALVLFVAAAGCTRHATTAPAHDAARAAAPPSAAAAAGRGPDPALSGDAATQLAAAFQREGSAVNVSGSDVEADGHRFAVRVAIERVIDQGDHSTAAIDVAMDLDGRPAPALHTSAVAIDADQHEAVAHAVREWAVAYAIPTVAALRYAWHGAGDAGPSDGGAGVLLALGTYRVFAGPTGVRGEPPPGWDALGSELHRTFFARDNDALVALLGPRGADADVHSFKLALHVVDGAIRDGDCRVDGVPSPRLCQAARDYPWPTPGGDFLFKQFYVLVPRAR